MNLNDSPNKSISNVSQIFISPKKQNPVEQEMERFVKIKQKVLNPVTEISQIDEISSFNNKMFESMATLNKDNEEPFEDSQSLGRPSAFDVARPS